jgi:hypothetical protein
MTSRKGLFLSIIPCARRLYMSARYEAAGMVRKNTNPIGGNSESLGSGLSIAKIGH